MLFRHRFRVIYGDTDMMGVVYYANYLRYFEAGRNEFLRSAGLEYKSLEAMGFGLPVANVQVKYHRPAHYDDELTLETELLELRHSSLRIGYRLHREIDDTLITTGETTHACIGPDGRLARLPEELRTKLSSDGVAGPAKE